LKRSAVRVDPRARPPFRQRLAAWREAHLFSLVSSLGRLAERPFASLSTAAVMGLALALPFALLVVVKNLERLGERLGEAGEIALFLEREGGMAAAEALAARVRAREDVARVEVRTPEQGLAELAGLPGFAEAAAALEENPLPPVLLVLPVEGLAAEREAALAAALAALPGVELAQYDAEWRRRFDALVALAHRASLVFGLLLGLGALLVVGNTVRLDIQGRAEEIAIVQLMGATDAFVRRPFLYGGLWYGLAAALLALMVVLVGLAALAGPVARLSASYGAAYMLWSPGVGECLALLAGSLLLGWGGAYLASSRHLARNAA
jgi:cell division transport system permease protein